MSAFRATRDPSAVHDTAKILALRRGLAGLATEVDGLAASSARHAATGADCMEALRASAEALVAQLAEARANGDGLISGDSLTSDGQSGTVTGRDPVVARRRAQLEEEVRAMERRAARWPEESEVSVSAGVALAVDGGGINGRAWAASYAERQQVLEVRLAQAEAAADASRAAAEAQAQEAVQGAEAYLAELRKSRRNLENSISAASGGDWRARFEALVVAQNVAADRATRAADCGGADLGAARLDQALSAALLASQQHVNATTQAAASTSAAGAAGAAGGGFTTATAAAHCVAGMAEAERRRRGLLVEAWRKLQGEDPRLSASGRGGLVPVDRVFTPRRTRDWELDLSCGASRNATPGLMGARESVGLMAVEGM